MSSEQIQENQIQENQIQENCYWYQKGEGEDAVMDALCIFCAKEQNTGWFWEGKRLGYGDYDLFCSSCNNAIYLRKK